MQLRKFRDVLNTVRQHQVMSNNSAAEVAPSAIEMLPRGGRTLLAKARWYVSPRYWRQAVAAVGIYTGVLMFWGYLVR